MYIYKITNKLTKRSYIGQTKDLFVRWREHTSKASYETMEISKDIQDLGIENFIFEVVEVFDDERLADEKEVYYIALYDTFNNGYNNTKGGKNSFLGYRLDVEIEEIVDYYLNNPKQSCRATATHFRVHHETVSRILKERGIPLVNGKETVYLVDKRTSEKWRFLNKAQASRFVKEREPDYTATSYSIAKRLSEKGIYKDYYIEEVC